MTRDHPAPRWLNQDEQGAWLAFIAVVELLPGQLDAQLQRDAGDTHFEYLTMAMLSDAPEHTLRMTTLAARTHATLPRLSHVVTRLADRGYVERIPCPEDKRATNAKLTRTGWDHLQTSAPGHVATVRNLVIDPLTHEQIDQLHHIATSILARLQ
jgi:DNA-binding MarR family transcriptional regulator